MNVVHAHTFLEIAECGNFNTAAANLNVTQSTVSMRIKALENSLGQALLVRNRSGVQLTHAGMRFRRYAESLIRTCQQMRQEIALPPHLASIVGIGGEYSLWDGLLTDWIVWFRRNFPKIAIKTEAGEADIIMRNLAEGALNVGVVYTPQARSGLLIEKLFVEPLVLVSREPRPLMSWSPDYVYVEWGSDFREAHSQTYPHGNTPSVTMGLGSLSLQYILKNGGSGYFPLRCVQPLVAEGRLHIVADAPRFERDVYCVYPASLRHSDWLTPALNAVRQAAAGDG